MAVNVLKKKMILMIQDTTNSLAPEFSTKLEPQKSGI